MTNERVYENVFLSAQYTHDPFLPVSRVLFPVVSYNIPFSDIWYLPVNRCFTVFL